MTLSVLICSVCFDMQWKYTLSIWKVRMYNWGRMQCHAKCTTKLNKNKCFCFYFIKENTLCIAGFWLSFSMRYMWTNAGWCDDWQWCVCDSPAKWIRNTVLTHFRPQAPKSDTSHEYHWYHLITETWTLYDQHSNSHFKENLTYINWARLSRAWPENLNNWAHLNIEGLFQQKAAIYFCLICFNTSQATSLYLTQWWLVYWHIYAFHSLNEWMVMYVPKTILFSSFFMDQW